MTAREDELARWAMTPEVAESLKRHEHAWVDRPVFSPDGSVITVCSICGRAK